MQFSYQKRQFDLVIIGSGGAGLRAAIAAYESGVKNIAIISKVHASNSHTVAAKGGINASLENITKDDPAWHAFDTIKGSDYLADKDAVDILCQNAKEAILDLEKRGVNFSRLENGKIAQRAYGGQSLDFGKGDFAYRACYAKDKTGQTILHTLMQQALKYGIKFFEEFFVSDLFISSNSCKGCLAIDLNLGELVIFESKITVIACGGYSQIYKNTTSSLICSGDGNALLAQEGYELQDMEFIQFHPTGIANKGFLITEATRGEGAYLLNKNGERFMEKYQAKMKELASRDVISRAMFIEVLQGRGCGKNNDYLHLDLRHLSDMVIDQKLPGVKNLVEKFLHLDVKKDLIPVFPSAHYTMGGIATNIDTFAFDGLAAIGEAACVSVHGANRLGCNSLLDLVVFGKICGEKSAQKIKEMNLEAILDEEILAKITKFEEIFGSNNGSSLFAMKGRLQQANEKYLGVFRDEKLLKSGFAALKEIFEEFKNYRISSKNLIFNDELISYFELKSLILNSLAASFSALSRCESRGAHYRDDFNEKDDSKFLAHSRVKFTDFDKIKLEFSTSQVRV